MSGHETSAPKNVEGGSFALNLAPNLGAAWQRSEECRQAVEVAARVAAGHAARLAPDNPKGPAQDLHRSIEGRAVADAEGRWYGLVVAGDWKAHFYEFGTSRQAARPFLRPGAESAGLTFEDPG